MKILKLQAENVKRLSAVEITPDGQVVIIGGANEAGKSSALDSIEYLFGGAKTLPAVPVRSGAKMATIQASLTDDPACRHTALVVQRTIKADGKTQLTVTSKGRKLASPQAVLEELFTQTAFDPVAFIRESPKRQGEILRQIVGLDFSELDAKRKVLYEDRTLKNRDVLRLKGERDAITHHSGVPTLEVSTGDLTEKLNQQVANKAAKAQAEAAVNAAHREADAANIEIARLQEALRVAEGRHRQCRDALAATVARANLALDDDMDATAKLIAAAEETNRQIHSNVHREELTQAWTVATEESEKLTREIEEIDRQKQDVLSAAEWPVEGLGFNDDGVTFKELPFTQASQAEQIPVSMAMSVAANPTLRVVLIRDGSLLDDAHLTQVIELAEEMDLQVWMERVGDGEECSVVIEDGAVRPPDRKGEP